MNSKIIKNFPTSDSEILKSFHDMKNLLSDDGSIKTVDSNEEIAFLIKDKPYAFLRLKNNYLIAQFKKPENLGYLAEKISYYFEVKYYSETWLEFRTIADGDYSDQINADLGSFIGQTLIEQYYS